MFVCECTPAILQIIWLNPFTSKKKKVRLKETDFLNTEQLIDGVDRFLLTLEILAPKYLTISDFII